MYLFEYMFNQMCKYLIVAAALVVVRNDDMN